MKSRHEFADDEIGQKQWQEYCLYYFSALSMQGLLANKYFQTYRDGMLLDDRLAKSAVDAGGALLTELKKQTP